jgi:hypothetical protein
MAVMAPVVGGCGHLHVNGTNCLPAFEAGGSSSEWRLGAVLGLERGDEPNPICSPLGSTGLCAVLGGVRGVLGGR